MGPQHTEGERTPEETEALPGFRPRTVVGRFVILRALGEGGNGRVYSAYDNELERRVAIKILLSEGEAGDRSREHERLLWEAKALAKISHPNVVPLYEVGLHEGRVWVAMEHVDGASLRQWCVAPRPWAQVLSAIIALGEGLAAVHRAGLLHRDIKPDNAVVGSDGRVRLVDFGLARTVVSREPDPQVGWRTQSVATPATTLGWGGAGTVGYSPPEQLRGPDIGPAADQFALCVTAWELLYGVRPWPGRSADEFAAAMATLPPSAGSDGRSVPTVLRLILERGLALEPSSRFEGMAALLAELRLVQSRMRRRRLAGLGVVGLLVAGSAVGYVRLAEWQVRRECDAAGDQILGDWTPARRSSVHAALVGAGVPYATETAELALPRLDAFAESWSDAQSEVCRQAELHRSWDPEAVDRARWCLSESRRRFQVWVDLATAQPSLAVPVFSQAVRTLPVPSRCSNPERLQQVRRPPAELEEEVEVVQAALPRVAMLSAAGQDAQARTDAEDLVRDAQRIGWPPLVSQTSLALASTLEAFGANVEAERAAEDAYFGALRGPRGDGFDAAIALALITGPRLRRWDDANRWVRAADAAALDPDEPTAASRLATVRGHVADGRGEYLEAKEHYERALQMEVVADGPAHPMSATLLSNLANIHRQLGHLEDAVRLHRQALTVAEACYGPHHPDVAGVLLNLSNAFVYAGSYDEAKLAATRALEIQEAVYGRDSEPVRRVLINLAIAESRLGDVEQMVATFERIAELTEQRFGPDDMETADALGNLAVTLQTAGRAEETLPLLRRALDISERHLGGDHPDVALARFNLGVTLQQQGEHAKAIEEFAGALRSLETTFGVKSHQLVGPLAALAESSAELGDLSVALSYGERAMALAEQEGTLVDHRAFATFITAHALWHVSRPGSPGRARAVRLAREARNLFSRPGVQPGGREHVEAWIAERDAG